MKAAVPLIFTALLGLQSSSSFSASAESRGRPLRDPAHYDGSKRSKRPKPQPVATPPSPPPVATPPAKEFPNTDDGKPILQLGEWTLNYWAVNGAFIDIAKATNGGSGFHPGKDGNYIDNSAEPARLLNPETLTPASLGSYTEYLPVLFNELAGRSEALAQYYAGTYVATWDGDADVGFAGWCPSGSRRVSQPHRIEITLTNPAGNRDHCAVSVTRIGQGFGNLRLFRKENEARLAGGEVFTPEFISELKGYKVVRLMDWSGALGLSYRKADELKSEKALAYGSTEPTFAGRGLKMWGAPLSVQFRLARDADVALWANVSPFLGDDAELDTIEQRGYAWNEIDKVIADYGLRQGAKPLASAEWDKYGDAVVAAMNAGQYPKTKRFYLEVGNEIWNYANPYYIALNYFKGVGTALGRQDNFRYAYGYYSGRMAKALAEALARAGRSDQLFTLVIGSWTESAGSTEEALKGYGDYFRSIGQDPAPWYARAGVAVTSYYQGAFSKNSGAFRDLGLNKSDDDYAAALYAEVKNDPIAAARKWAKWTITGGDCAGKPCELSLPDIAGKRKAHAAVAAQYGAAFIGDYEGGDHELVSPLNQAPYNQDPAVLAMVKEYRYGATGAAVTKAWIDQMAAATPGAIISDYLGAYTAPDSVSLGDPWTACAYATPCPAGEALKPYLRTPQ